MQPKRSKNIRAHELIFDRRPQWLRKWLDLYLISPKHPFALKIFRSELRIANERIRQLQSGYYYTIHPFNTFRTFYSCFQIIIYFVALCFGLYETAFLERNMYTPVLLGLLVTNDILCYIDVLTNFYLGYTDNNGEIILEPRLIAKKYLLGYFICDLLGAVPYIIGFRIFDNRYLRGVLSICRSLRLFRLITILHLIEDLRIIFGIKSRRLQTVFSTTLTFFTLCHFMACYQVLVYKFFER